MNRPSPLRAVLPLALLVVLTGCSTRSISNSGFSPAYASPRASAPSMGYGYVGELSEFDVLGVSLENAAISEADIQSALLDKTELRLTRQSKVLLIQSGADFPDAPMLGAMQTRFETASFSGRPLRSTDRSVTQPSYARSLRLAAARGGYDKIVCYWGVLESERIDKVTSIVSWVPIVGYVIPDERENMRLRLKAAVIDVATGRWQLVNPPAISRSSLSTVLSRKETDQDLVNALKAEGYRSLAQYLADNRTS